MDTITQMQVDVIDAQIALLQKQNALQVANLQKRREDLIAKANAAAN